jgi:hypothetical protein
MGKQKSPTPPQLSPDALRGAQKFSDSTETDKPVRGMTFVEEIQSDLAKLKSASRDDAEYYQNTMIYFARKQSIFLYDIRHWLKEMFDLQIEKK